MGSNSKNRRVGTELGNISGGGSAFGEGNNGSSIKAFRNLTDGMGNRIGNIAATILKAGEVFLLFDAVGDPSHSCHCFHRIFTHGSFIGKHHSISAVEDRVCHVTNFGSSGAG